MMKMRIFLIFKILLHNKHSIIEIRYSKTRNQSWKITTISQPSTKCNLNNQRQHQTSQADMAIWAITRKVLSKVTVSWVMRMEQKAYRLENCRNSWIHTLNCLITQIPDSQKLKEDKNLNWNLPMIPKAEIINQAIAIRKWTAKIHRTI